MPRQKTEKAIFVENYLSSSNNRPRNYHSFINSEEYEIWLAEGHEEIVTPFFNNVKNRFLKEQAVVNRPVIQPSKPVPQIASVSKPAWSYGAEAQKLIPALDNNFIVSSSNKALIALIKNHSNNSSINHAKVRLVGPAGCGKTSFAMNYAAKNNLPCLVMDCANVREPRDWFGYRTFDPSTKDIIWNESLFVKMIETPGAVIVLDELNRVSQMVTNTLIPLLDHRSQTYLEEAGRVIKVAEGVTWWAAINEGNQFTGTTAMDNAMKDRFSYVVECDFLPEEEEVKVLNQKTGLDDNDCMKLVDIANQVRRKCLSDGSDSFTDPISTRMLEAAAMGLLIGGPQTLNYTIANHFSNDGGSSSERASIKQMLVGKFGSI